MYLCNFGNDDDFQCILDGDKVDGIEDMAYPCGVMIQSMDDILKVQELATKEWNDAREDPDDKDQQLLTIDRWVCIKRDDEVSTYGYILDDGSVYGVIIARKVEFL